MDIDLEEEEDSSDEEYCPGEQEEEDTAEEVSPPSVVLCCVVLCRLFTSSCVCAQTLPSDGDSLSSPPRMHRGSQAQCAEAQQVEALQVRNRTRSNHQGALLMWLPFADLWPLCLGSCGICEAPGRDLLPSASTPTSRHLLLPGATERSGGGAGLQPRLPL